MVELVDTRDLKSRSLIRSAGSIPALGTMKKFATLGHKLFHNVHERELKKTLGYSPNEAKLLLELSNIHCVSFFESIQGSESESTFVKQKYFLSEQRRHAKRNLKRIEYSRPWD